MAWLSEQRCWRGTLTKNNLAALSLALAVSLQLTEKVIKISLRRSLLKLLRRGLKTTTKVHGKAEPSRYVLCHATTLHVNQAPSL